MKTQVNKNRIIFLFGVYFVILLWFVLMKCNDVVRLCPEWQPHRTIVQHFLDGAVPFRNFEKLLQTGGMELVIFFANFVLFMPMGFLFPYLMGKGKSVALVFAAALSIELCQLFTGWGGYDTTDVIMTFLGGAFGVWLHSALHAELSNRTVNKIALWMGVVFLPLAVFAIAHTVVNFPPIYPTSLW